MDFEQALVNIFGISPLNDFSSQTDFEKYLTKKPNKYSNVYASLLIKTNHCRQLEDINLWLESKLNSFREIQVNEDGKIGASKVAFDVKSAESTSIKISKNKLSLHSISPFSTLRANCCVYSGKWIYEVQLKSKGVMQIGNLKNPKIQSIKIIIH